MFTFLRPSNLEFSKAQQIVLKFRGNVSWGKRVLKISSSGFKIKWNGDPFYRNKLVTTTGYTS